MGRDEVIVDSIRWCGLLAGGVIALLMMACGSTADEETTSEFEVDTMQHGGLDQEVPSGTDLDVETAQQEISNGIVVNPDYSGVVQLVFTDTAGASWRCTGTLVTNSHIVTAWHCVNHSAPIIAMMGNQATWVSQRDLHPVADLALIEVNPPFRMRVNGVLSTTGYARPFDLSSMDDLDGQTLMCAGYGGTGTLRMGFFVAKKLIKAPGYLLDVDRVHLPVHDAGWALQGGDSGGPCLQYAPDMAAAPLVTENFAVVGSKGTGIGYIMAAYWAWIYLAAVN